MVAVEKYIRKLLYEQDCVIIPEMGGLITHHINAQFNSSSGVYMPSQKRVAFNEVLKLDDGLLTYFISVNENISREEALTNVKRYTESIRASLREEGKAVIPGVGDFRNNNEGKLVFEPESTQNFNVDWFGLQAVKAVELKSLMPQEKLAELPEAATVAPLYTEKAEVFDGESGEEDTSTRKVKWGWSGWAASAVVAGMAFYLSVFYAPGSTPGATSSMLSTLNPFYGIAEYVQTTIADRMAKSAQADLYSETVVVEDELPVAPLESISALTTDSAALSAPAAGTAPGLTPVPSTLETEDAYLAQPENAVKNYYIIAGCFDRIKNARILLDQLHRGGYTEAFILKQKGSDFIKVTAQGFDTQREAYSSLKGVEKVVGEGVWVYRNRR